MSVSSRDRGMQPLASIASLASNGTDDILPVIYVVNATVRDQQGGNNDAGPDEPTLSSGQDNSLYESFLASLQHNTASTNNTTLTVGRWRHGRGAEIHVPDVQNIINDFYNDDDANNATAAADSTFSKDNPQVNFMSRRARVLSVSRRHAFPPSKCPQGKMTGMTTMVGETQHGSIGNAWLSSYNVQLEGILPTGWLEKHAHVLPSALVVVTTIFESSLDDGHLNRHVIQAVEDFRMTLAEKRSVPIYLVCLTNSDVGIGKNTNRTRDNNVAMLKEKICEECFLPHSQVFLLNYPKDLEPDEFENAVLRSTYRSGTQDASNNLAVSTPTMMNPLLRQLDRSLRDSSAVYYSRLAEAHERKLSLWRNRYHSSNSSFEISTLIAGIRCARYALKVAIMRELQMRTGSTSTWSSFVDGGVKWTDKGSLSMRFYEEAYRWVIELHRRAVTWRATSNNKSGSDLTTPRNESFSKQIVLPNITESPGGGSIGVELPLPSFQAKVIESPIECATTPPTSSRTKGSGGARDIVLYTKLWQQCRAVGSIINSKLLCSSNVYDCQDTLHQWRRHRLIFLASPQGIEDYDPSQYDDFFGPLWYRMLFATEELRIVACNFEEKLRRGMLLSSKNGTTMPKPSFHQVGAPWKVYGELAEAILGVGAEMKRQKKQSAATNDRDDKLSVNFVGSNAAKELRLINESQRDHKGIALEYILHALDLFEEAEINAEPLISIRDARVSSASVRLHYLAGRLLMSIENPISAAVHLRIAAERTKKWPSLHVSIQRALLVCEERCLSIEVNPTRKIACEEASKMGCAKLLLEPESCALLTKQEIKHVKSKAWEMRCKEVLWKDASGESRPPFDFALSFLKSTHATSGDSVLACLSIKSRVGFECFAKTIKLLTTVGNFNVSTANLCLDKAQLQSWLKSSSSRSGDVERNSSVGVHLIPNEVAYILTEISLPSDFSSVPLGDTAIDNNFYTPKSGKLTNCGLTHAAGNICQSLQQKLMPIGRPVAVTSLPWSSTSFLGGIPFVCNGVELELVASVGSSATGTSPLKLRVEKSLLLSPLGRSGNQLLQMEECGYMAHAWSRPDHQLWCLGPRCLRILGPRPQMKITNLTEPHTNGIAIEGTVNRVVFMLQVGPDVDCRGVRLSIRCRHSSGTVPCEVIGTVPSEVGDDDESVGAIDDVEPERRPVFVKRSTNEDTQANGIPLPKGWELRNDVSTDESNMSVITPHLGAGKSMLLPLDLFRPVNSAGDSSESDSCTTSYELSISYRQVRTVKGISQPSDLGDQVVVVRSGTVTWISPFTAEFSQVDRTQKSFPCGIKHASNMVQSASNDPGDSSALIAADGERIRIRCHLKAKEVGNNVAASIEYVANENETDEQEKYLYSTTDVGLFFAESKQGSQLSLSYSITAKTSAAVSGTMSLGTISLGWRPACMTIPHEATVTDTNNNMMGEFGLAHGPLTLPDITPMKFYGPKCQVLDAPFEAKKLKCPSAPKVGTPFRVSYQVTNQTAKSQTLTVSLSKNSTGTLSHSQILVVGKLQGETHMAPWEQKEFSFTFMSMVAGKVPRPLLSVSSGRHQTWVIHESNVSSHSFYVMP